VLGDLLLHLTPADLALLERGDADADGDVRSVLECLAGVEVHGGDSPSLATSVAIGLGGGVESGWRPSARPPTSTLATITLLINSCKHS
jgi:hypothetical protein